MAAWEQRFESKVDRSGTCHLWTGAKTPGGVGQVRIDGKLRTAAQVAWELAHGEVAAGGRVHSCPDNKLCVRADHLSVDAAPPSPDRNAPHARADRGSGSMRETAPGKWKLTVDAGRDGKGRRRRLTRIVRGSRRDATRALAVLTSEVQSGVVRPSAEPSGSGQVVRVDDLVEWYLTFAREVRGLERTTVAGYGEVYRLWLKDQIGHVSAERLTPGEIDNAFGRMRQGGLSHSRMNNARGALAGAFKWGRRHGKVNANPMRGFELPKSIQVPKRTTAPELDDLLKLLDEATRIDPEIAPVLTLAATTGMRRGELSGLRRSRLDLELRQLLRPAAGCGAGAKFESSARSARSTARSRTSRPRRTTPAWFASTEPPSTFSVAISQRWIVEPSNSASSSQKTGSSSAWSPIAPARCGPSS